MFSMLLNIGGEPVRVYMHDDPHFEEIAAAVALVDHGAAQFLNKYCRMGELNLGAFGGPFDEHPDRLTGQQRKNGCCLTLVAEALGLEQFPWWRELIAFCHFADMGQRIDGQRHWAVEVRHPYDPYNLLKLRYRKLRDEARRAKIDLSDEALLQIFNGAMEDVRLLLWKQKMYFLAVDEIKAYGRCEDINGSNGKQLKLVAITSDNWQINVAARSWFHADVVVQRDGAERVHVFTNQKADISLSDLAQMLNLAEQEAEGFVHMTNWKTLRAEGAIEDGKWFYLFQFGQIHNGTESYPDTPATLLSNDQILGLVKIALDKSYFNPEQSSQCRRGVCNSRGVCDCPLHKYGLQRCRTIRFDMYASRRW